MGHKFRIHSGPQRAELISRPGALESRERVRFRDRADVQRFLRRFHGDPLNDGSYRRAIHAAAPGDDVSRMSGDELLRRLTDLLLRGEIIVSGGGRGFIGGGIEPEPPEGPDEPPAPAPSPPPSERRHWVDIQILMEETEAAVVGALVTARVTRNGAEVEETQTTNASGVAEFSDLDEEAVDIVSIEDEEGLEIVSHREQPGRAQAPSTASGSS